MSVAGLPPEVEVDPGLAPPGSRPGCATARSRPACTPRAGRCPTSASLPHISVAGAVATGTHGSGDANGSLATSVVGLDLVTADGEA